MSRSGRVGRTRFFGRAALVGMAAIAACAVYLWASWPDVGRLARSFPESTAFIDAYRRESGTDPLWTPVPYTAVSVHLKRAVLVAEDIDFFSHEGFAVDEMKKAVRDAWEDREFPRGASTITQQLAKNLWLSPSRNPLRKVKEAVLTRQLERTLEKKRILALYLSVVEFGPGVYGAEAAARKFFGKPAATLTENEAAQLAAGLPRPRSWHPGATARGYARRVASIERRMEKARWLWNVL